jgi:hypothetical protein
MLWHGWWWTDEWVGNIHTMTMHTTYNTYRVDRARAPVHGALILALWLHCPAGPRPFPPILDLWILDCPWRSETEPLPPCQISPCNGNAHSHAMHAQPMSARPQGQAACIGYSATQSPHSVTMVTVHLILCYLVYPAGLLKPHCIQSTRVLVLNRAATRWPRLSTNRG